MGRQKGNPSNSFTFTILLGEISSLTSDTLILTLTDSSSGTQYTLELRKKCIRYWDMI